MQNSIRSSVLGTIRTSLLLAIVLFAATAARAQQVDTTHWNDEELYTEEASETPYFAVGGGVIGSLFMPNLESFNANIARPFVGKDVNNKIFMIGGQGFITLPWVKNVRVGGIGMSGTCAQCCVDTVAGAKGDSVRRSLEYRIGFGGVTLDYVLPLHIRKFNIVPGIELGYGSVEVYAEQATRRTREFDIRNEFDEASVNTTHTYHSNFFSYMPQLQFEYNPIGFMMIRAAVGYHGTSMGTWTVDNDVDLYSTKHFDNVNGSGLVASLGVFFGLFP